MSEKASEMSVEWVESVAPCPFCATESTSVTSEEEGVWFVVCENCGARGPEARLATSELKRIAWFRWNARVDASPPTEAEEARGEELVADGR